MQDGPRLAKQTDDPPGEKAVRGVCTSDSSKQLRARPAFLLQALAPLTVVLILFF